ncbi:MAG: D-alanyl-D-alanine carboxypeptidase family protein [Roseiarcus sp.]|jgi:D-alanyl-D-alanine carboxypeptidase
MLGTMASKANCSKRLPAALLVCALSLGLSEAAAAGPSLVVDVDSGQTLSENNATEPWYPASLTKLMTTYVALQAVRDGRLTLDTPLTMSARAAAMPASKMGFAPGVEVTLDNALKMLMVKSPNDVAVMIAESIDGSVEAFAAEMNATALKLGVHESHFVNPNGLHDPAHVSSARDMAIVARALLRDFPEQLDLYGIGALQLGDEIIANHNGLLGRYPGADGMKTGFTCPAGFNVVATATHGGRRLIVVVLGAPSPLERTMEAARLFDAGFAKWGGGEGPPESLADSAVRSAPDMRGEICSRRNRAAVLAAEEENEGSPANVAGQGAPYSAFMQAPAMTIEDARKPVHFDAEPIFIGPKPGWTGPVLAAKPTGADAGAGGPNAARAYVNDKPPLAEGAEAQGAPAALKGALKPVKLAPLAARPHNSIAAKLKKQRVAAKAKKPAADAPLPPAH